MNEHLEQTRPEEVLSQVIALATDSSELGDLITESWATEYASSTGMPAVQQPAAPVETEIVELKSMLLALLRFVWKTPTRLFGGSTLGAAVNNGLGWLRSRLLGDTEYGIPAYPNAGVEEAKSILSLRRISGADVPDGMSMARLLFDTNAANLVTELTDETYGWTLSKAINLGSTIFANLTGATIGCSTMAVPSSGSGAMISGTMTKPVRFQNLQHITGGQERGMGTFNLTTPLLDLPELIDTHNCAFGGGYAAVNMPKFQRVYDYHYYQSLFTGTVFEHITLPAFNFLLSSYYYETAMFKGCSNLKDISLPIWTGNSNRSSYEGVLYKDVLCWDCPELLEINMPNCTLKQWNLAINCPKLWKVVFGKVTSFVQGGKGKGHSQAEFYNCGNLIHIEFGSGVAANINLGNWSPTNALSDSADDLVTDTGLTTNLQQFLANFSAYIIDRLAQRTASTTLTLTLSQAVRNVLTAEQELAIANKFWNINPANKTT